MQVAGQGSPPHLSAPRLLIDNKLQLTKRGGDDEARMSLWSISLRRRAPLEPLTLNLRTYTYLLRLRHPTNNAFEAASPIAAWSSPPLQDKLERQYNFIFPALTQTSPWLLQRLHRLFTAYSPLRLGRSLQNIHPYCSLSWPIAPPTT